MKKIIAAALMAFSLSVTYAQKTHIGIEFGVSKDIYKLIEISDAKAPSGNLQLRDVRPHSKIYGFSIRQELNPTFYIETGLLSKTYQGAISFNFEKEAGSYSSASEFNSLIIPVNLGARLNLLKHKIHLTSNVGYSFVKNYLPPFAGYGEGRGFMSYGSTYAEYSTKGAHHAKSHSLFQTGLGLDFKLGKSLSLTLAANHYQGFKKIHSQDIRYSVNYQPEQAAQSYSTGSMRTYNIGLKYSLGSFIK